MPKDKKQSCLLCGSTDAYEKYILSAHAILRCRGCDFMWLHPQPEIEQLKKIYSDAYFDNKELLHGEESCIYGYHDYIAERFNKQVAYRPIVRTALTHLGNCGNRNVRFLDVGCGLGFLMDVAQDEGCSVAGIEFNTSAIEKIKKKYIFPVFKGDLLDFNDNTAFDIVAMMDVIEHFLCPLKAVRKVNSLLKPNGIFVLSTMDSDSLVSRILGKRLEDFRRVSEHLYFFTRKTIKDLLEQEGFYLIDIKYYGHTFQLDFLANRLQNVSYTLGQTFGFFVNTLRLNNAKLYINPRTKILIYARKRP